MEARTGFKGPVRSTSIMAWNGPMALMMLSGWSGRENDTSAKGMSG